MRDVCNGAKHGTLTKTRNPVVRRTGLHEGAFSSQFSKQFDVSVLEVEMTDGNSVCFDEEVKKSLLFWQGKMSALVNIPSP